MSNDQQGSINREVVSLANAATGGVESAAAPEFEAVALEALDAARLKNLQPVIDRLLDALSEDDDTALATTLQGIYNDLPAIIESAGQDNETLDLMNRIFLGAVQQGEKSADLATTTQ